MAQHLKVLAFFLPLILGVVSAGNSSITTESLVQQHGYPIETHKVTTEDGYILTLHRIPYSARVPSTGPRKVVFIMHGLLCSSNVWVLAGPENGLGFILSDAGYDVWMGNARGNTYSRSHVSMNPAASPFWNFDWHEIGVYDLPAMLGYARNVSGVDKMVYIGHSQGTSAFFVLTSLYPKYNDWIETAHLLSPVAYMGNLSSKFVTYSAPILGSPIAAQLLDILGYFEFKANKLLMKILGTLMCDPKRPNYILCTNALFLAAGFDEETVDNRLVDLVMETTPSGASIKQFLHYMQEFNSRKFRQFDYGIAKNMIKYGQATPPDYPVENIRAPVYLYYSDSDAVVAVKDVETLMTQLKTLQKAYRVPEKKFDHLGQMYNGRIRFHVYDHLLDNVLSYGQKQLIF